ncbi:multidrug ABC transporter ATPase [Kitasatospora sp. MMS16-BH015]|uniref:ABC transporter ATP-binding protein n=1 Tax=Kitasatospora sp. MMS16-BH015 TaxID=2018025 RepID=UPI000CA1AB8A|nr:ABC transporter ATP-binding protein [Kitasatospora sp. MMS16-BH015]AUG81645.1 multidrug ABC transporter ATPase [Kitasatospora sp. MMS16-BH015]
MSGGEVIELHEVRKRFGEVTAVDGLSLRVAPGEVVAFLGPNGAGKSTTIDLLLGLARPDSGTVRVCGRPPVDAVRRGLVAAVLQSGGLLRDFTVAETVRYVASVYPAARPVKEVLELAGLTRIAGRRVGKCSGGEQQRLRFALALLPEPRLLVLDEPTTGMDVEGRQDFWKAVRRDADRGRTVLFATHYLDEADAYADRIVVVREGAVVADGPAATIKNLATGRQVRAVWPEADPAAVRALPGVDSAEAYGDSVLLRTRDSDRVVRHLLNHTEARDLEVTATLESAFVALTGRTSAPPAAGGTVSGTFTEEQR